MAEEKTQTKPQSSRAIVLSPDILENYDISYGAELNEFSSEFASAYQARSKKGGKTEYYALVFKNSFAADLDKMNTLRDLDAQSIQKLVDFGKIRTGQSGDNLCAILTKPSGIKLSQLMEEKGPLDETYVMTHIFNQIEATVDLMHSEKIMHGCINPDNIYFNSKNNSITLKENISEYPGYSQKASFETYERMVCHKAGKSYREFEADYYAIGVTLTCLINGSYIFTSIPDEIVRKIKFENGTFDSLFSMASAHADIKISSSNQNLIKGFTHDKTADRWTEIQVKKWRKREISQSTISRLHKQSSTAFNFEDIDYYSPKYLAYMISKNWTVAKKNIKIDDLARWLSFTSKFSDIEDKLFNMTKSGKGQVIIPDEKLARILCLMDEGGPLRYKNITFHPDGLGNLLSYLNENKDDELVDNIITAIDFGLIDSWVSCQIDKKLYKKSVLGWNPTSVKFYARKKEIGFGFERVLYETSKYIPCQSSILINRYSVGLPALLMNLDSKRLSYNEEDNPVDDHITAYICKSTNIEDTIKIKQLHNFPSIAKLKEVKYCAIFALAQKETEIASLPALTQWIREGLNKISSMLNSKNVKESFNEKLDKAVASGDLNKLFQILTDPRLIRTDLYGFKEAKQQYKILSFEILKLKSQQNIDQLAYRMGLRVSVVFSYLICIVSALSLLVLSF